MDRREWVKNCSIVTGGLSLPALSTKEIFTISDSPLKSPEGIKEIHLINLSHTDFGYTDLPSSTWDFQVSNIRLAMKYIEETSNYPIDYQFKWTAESVWILERFLEQATNAEKDKFNEFVENGSIEITAMPGNMSVMNGRHEWERELDRLSDIYKKYHPKVAVQNDVNGITYGMVESLLNRNVNYISMNSNLYSGGVPVPAPSLFWWQGAGNNKILVNNGEGYNSGFSWFNPKEWRRGPVPNRYDIWFNPPTGNEIFSSDKTDVQAAFEQVNKMVNALSKKGYPHSALMLSVTNNYIYDNDLPCRQLSEFIRVWNEMGLQPKLIFSTPSRFFGRIKAGLTSDIVTLKGEWSDWWADGIGSAPVEISLFKSAQRRNLDIENALKYLNISDSSISEQIIDLNHDLVFSNEHTWGSYDSAAYPYGARTLGTQYQKFEIIYRLDENAKRIQSELLKETKDYKPLSRTSFIEVFNPGNSVRSGWVEISAQALRIKANAVKEISSGKIFPFEQTLASEWNISPEGITTPPVEFPNDVWPYKPGKYRFFTEKMKPGERKRYELLESSKVNLKRNTEERYFMPHFEKETGLIKNISFVPQNKLIFDDQADKLPAQLIIERPQGKYCRDAIAEKRLDPADILYNTPEVIEFSQVDNPYALRYKSVLEENFAKRIEQQWDIFDSIPRIEITTTIWIKENLDPIAVYMAFPFSVQKPRIFYDSLGSNVEIGAGQMPNTCGECNNVHEGIRIQGTDINLALTTLDSPLGLFDAIVRGCGRKTFTPQTAHFYNLVCQNYWITNFPVLYPAKLVIRQIIECGKAGTDLLPVESNELWAYPCA
jgi:alpha-mannosidase